MPVIVLAQETSLDVMKVAPAVVAQLAVTMILVPIVIAQLTVPGKKALPRNILIGTVIGAVSLAVQYLAARYIGPETPAILGSAAAIAVIILLGRILDRRTARNSGTNTTPSKHRHSTKEILQAWAVYALIMLLILLTSPLLPIKDILAPVAETSIGFNIGGETRTWSVQWLVQGGLLLFIGSFAGGLLQGGKAGGLLRLLWKSTVQLKKTFITVICLVGFSSRHLGQHPFRQAAGRRGGTHRRGSRMDLGIQYRRSHRRQDHLPAEHCHCHLCLRTAGTGRQNPQGSPALRHRLCGHNRYCRIHFRILKTDTQQHLI